MRNSITPLPGGRLRKEYRGTLAWKREITLLTNRHRYLPKPAKHFISLTQALFASMEMERAGLLRQGVQGDGE